MHGFRGMIVAGAAMLVAATGAGAQVRSAVNVPPGFTPPPGMCRVWFDDLAPGRQPASTDCATARANLRAGSRLVYGAPLRTGDVRNDGGWINSRSRDDDRDGRYGQVSEKQRREWEKARRKREHEREKARRKAHRHRDRDWDRDRDDDDDDDCHGEHRGDHRGRDDSRNGGRIGIPGRTGGTVGIPGRTGGPVQPQGQCTDVNRDGICDNTQSTGRVRIP